MVLDDTARVRYASPNAVSSLHRVGISSNVIGQRLAELGFNDSPVRQAFERGEPVMEEFDQIRLNPDARVKTSWLYQLTRKINTEPSLYLKAGAIHGCVLAHEDRPLVYMEDVGRHNAVDKIAGYMFLNRVTPDDKIFYTTGRLTSEMVIKTVKMRIPVLVSRSGFTAWGVELAQKANLTLIGRARGRRFVALAGVERIVFDADPHYVPDESRRLQRKASLEDDAA